MQDNAQAPAAAGLSFTGALTIAFIVLKLAGAINWSWFWVLSPVLIGWGLIVLAVGFAVGITGVCLILDSRARKGRAR